MFVERGPSWRRVSVVEREVSEERERGRRMGLRVEACLETFLPFRFFLSFIECASSWRVSDFLEEEEGIRKRLEV